MTKTPHEQVNDLVDDLVEWWPHLVELRTPGTPRRWTEVASSPRVSADRLERLSPSAAPSPAPAVVSVLDLVQRVAVTAADVSTTVAAVAGVAPARLRSAWIDPVLHLEHARSCLRAADEADPLTAPWVIAELAPLVLAVATEVGEVRTGQTLRALCPWCRGRTTAVPTGGERTLQVILPDEAEEEAEPMIVCVGLICSPPPSKCGRRVNGRPAWPEREWDWLAKNLLELDEPTS